MTNFLKNFHLSWASFVDYLPALVGGIICFVITLIVANLVSGWVSKFSLRKTKDSLIANFIGKIAWSIIFIFGTVLTLGILGLGTISNKILAGAGITTFVVGFALKDIGENFLAGLVLAFGRPFRVGNFIECGSIKGIVKDMTMRQTTVENENGKLTLIPNSMIINNPLTKYFNNDHNLRQEFSLSVETAKVKEAGRVIADTLRSFEYIAHSETNPPKVIVDTLTGDKIKLLVVFWFNAAFKGSRSGGRSEIILAVIDRLQEAGVKISG